MPLRLLPLLDASDNEAPCASGRAAMTCRYRCGDACAHDAPNTSANPYFGDVAARAVSRRGILRAGAVIGAAGLAAGAVGASPAAAAPGKGRGKGGGKGHGGGRPDAAKGLDFTPVAPNTADAVTVPPGYAQGVVMAWGDPIFRGAPAFDPANQTAAAQQQQFGYNCDFLGLFPLGRGKHLMCVNHEYTDEALMFPAYDEANPTRDQVEIAWAAHGLSVVVVEEDRRSGALTPLVGHRMNRRFHTHSEFELTGPVAGHELVRTAADPRGRTALGTLNNCGGGTTQWGTWLTAEENFNQYFANAGAVTDPTTSERLARYGLPTGATPRQWEEFEDRFDLAKEPNEVNRFGWIVEIDPYDPSSTPKKRTALGRFKHEAAEPQVTRDGRVAVYMGDDERFDYFYKFVSDKKMARGDSWWARRHNSTLLDSGTLYVARFLGDSSQAEIDGSGALPSDGEFDGVGVWVPLVSGTTSYVAGMTAEEVLLFTRQAADIVGATKMDRPEDVEPSPRTGKVYVALTNNSNRGRAGYPAADEANPRNSNRHGQVLELTEMGNDGAAEAFTWDLFLVCGDPEDPSTYFAGYPKEAVSPISCPDNVTFDAYGNLWISTDGNALGSNDGLFGVAVDGEYRGQVKQFLTVPRGAETCGPYVDSDRVMVCVQHPGEIDGASYEAPASHWPDGGTSIPRPGVAAVWRKDGRSIGR
ncbi:hypothetical protein CLV56_2049 [Mumia flava]|uniref:Channel forming colicins domain-containing protein n=1 Tax=Mumia flava TaxID=1348852 RepID=A0A0B2B7M3_9ACTN|nr:PhoX family phosphatase [Mumia flava]PJJ57811.1 hypothetical protein CLV56_2049 [Mumia flava]